MIVIIIKFIQAFKKFQYKACKEQEISRRKKKKYKKQKLTCQIIWK